MAGPLPRLETVWIDASGSVGALHATVPHGTTVSAAFGAIDALTAALSPLTGCVLVRARVIYRKYPDVVAAAAPGSTIKRAGVLYFDAVGDNPGDIVTVYGIKDEYITSGDPMCPICIDLGAIDIAAFADAVISNGGCNPFGDALAALFSGYVESRV